MCAETYKTVTPEYFNEVLKYRYLSDEDSGIMLDYLREGLYFDLATINTLSLNSLGTLLRKAGVSGSNAPGAAASTLKANKKVYEKTLGMLISSYEKLN